MAHIKLFDSLADLEAKVTESSAVAMKVGDREICMVRFKDKFYAINNSCPHLGEKLSKGRINYLGEIVCPWHSYRFNLFTGEESERRCSDAITYPLKIEEDGTYIDL